MDAPLRRRTLIGLAGLIPLLPWRAARAGAVSGTPALPAYQTTLTAVLDTLIPADTSPGAVDLGVQHQLVGYAAARPALARVLRQGCAWLDLGARRAGNRGFDGLAEPERVALLREAESLGPQHAARRLMDTVLPLAMRFYYSDSRSWPTLGFDGPPQPRGFPDYSSAPRHGPA